MRRGFREGEARQRTIYLSLLFFCEFGAAQHQRSCCCYRGDIDSDISDIIYDEFRTWIAPLELVSVPMHEGLRSRHS